MTRTRRSILRTISGATVAAVGAGSLSAGAAAQPDRTGDTSDPVRYSQITTTSADCGGGSDDSHSDVSRWGQVVRFSGQIQAPTPCHEAVIAAIDVADDTLVVTVGTEPVDESQVCIECIGAIEYRGLLVLSGSADVESVEVRHADGASDPVTPDPDPSVTAEITETSGSCRSSRSTVTGQRELPVRGEVVEFDGTIETPYPCYEAVVDGVEVQGSTAVVTVVARRNAEICPACLGIVRYEGVVEIADPKEITTVEIVHGVVENSVN